MIEKNKWIFMFKIYPLYHIRELGWRSLSFGIFKLLEEPKEGMKISSHKKKGFFFSFNFWLPFQRDFL